MPLSSSVTWLLISRADCAMRLGREATDSAWRKLYQQVTRVVHALRLTDVATDSQHLRGRTEVSVGELRASGTGFSSDAL
jgi:hypothetical protein